MIRSPKTITKLVFFFITNHFRSCCRSSPRSSCIQKTRRQVIISSLSHIPFSQILDPDKERDKPLCMSQYPRIFCSSRIPGAVRDKLVTYTKFRPPGRSAVCQTTQYIDATPTHVVTLYRNQFYWFDVVRDGKIVSLDELECQFEKIIQLAEAAGDKDSFPIGVWTADQR